MYIVIKTIRKNGREYQYRYEQTSYRVGKRVKTKCRYLGPVGKAARAITGLIRANRTRSPVVDEMALLKAAKEREAKYAGMVERFHKETGLRVGPSDPTPCAPAPAEISGGQFAPSENSPSCKS